MLLTHIAEFVRPYHVRRTSLDGCGCRRSTGRWVSQIQWCSIWSEHHTLAIIIIWLHAMYWQSTKVLIFLIAIFLTINVPIGWITIRIMMHSPGGKIKSWMNHSNAPGSLMGTRGTHSLRNPPLQYCLWQLWPTSGCCDLGAHHCMGDHRTVFRRLDCHETLPRTATINRMGYRGLFHCFNKNSRAVLCKVSLHRECDTFLRWIFMNRASSFVATSSFHLSYLSPTISMVCRSVTDLCIQAQFNIYAVHRISDLSLSNSLACPHVCAGATLDPWCSQALC